MSMVLIVEALFYEEIADMLLEGATLALNRAGVAYDVVSVPGALEVPAAIRFAIPAGNYDGFVALGCVIRGETTHYETVCAESARGLMDLTIQFGAAIGNGILTVEDDEQAESRADKKDNNKGGAAAEACLSLMQLKYSLENA